MNLLVLSGGDHPYDETTPVLEEFLRGAGHDVQVTDDASTLVSEGLEDRQAVVFNTRRVDKLTLAEAERTALSDFIGGGKGFVAIHCAGIRPEAWPEYHDITGGGYIPGVTGHQPYGEFEVYVRDPGHPCSRGLSDFTTNDELYTPVVMQQGNVVFLTALVSGEAQPVAWTRGHGKGRVFYTILGHDEASFRAPGFQRLILNAVAWAGGGE